MRNFFFLLFSAFLWDNGFSQSVSCDLGFSNNSLKDASGGNINANNISIGQVGRIQVNIHNFSEVEAPARHFRIIIGLGTGLILNPGFNIANAPLNEYFSWTYEAIPGEQPQIYGNSIAPLPASFARQTFFQFKANSQASSTVTFNFLIDNPDGTTTPVSDPTTGNNQALNNYTVTGTILPVHFTSIAAINKDCNINVNWNVKTEESLSRYEVEVSKDGTAFSKVAESVARNLENYTSSFAIPDALKVATLYVRIKAIDKDGKSMYSSIATTKGQCNTGGKLAVMLYPNPVQSADYIMVQATEGVFNGKYMVSLVDKGGKVYGLRNMELSSLSQFQYPLGKIASGNYSIVIKGEHEGSATVVDFTKL